MWWVGSVAKLYAAILLITTNKVGSKTYDNDQFYPVSDIA